MSNIVDFYLNGGEVVCGHRADRKARTFDDMLAMTDEQLEDSHDVVQYLFPLNEESRHSFDAPILTTEDIQALSSVEGQMQYIRAMERFLKFYGMTRFPNGSKSPTILIEEDEPDIFNAKAQWITHNNHNFKRITRIIRCAMLLGRKDIAKLLCDGFSRLYWHQDDKYAFAISDTTLRFWNEAVTLPFDQKLNVSPQVRKIFRT